MQLTMKNTPFINKICAAILMLVFAAHALHAQIDPKQVEISPVNDLPIGQTNCPGLKAEIKKIELGEDPCCYRISLSNTLGAGSKTIPYGFQVELKNGSITKVLGTAPGWSQTPATVPPKVGKVTWQSLNPVPAGPLNLGTVCIQVDKPVWMKYTWLDRLGKVICQDSILMNNCIYENQSACIKQLIQNSEFSPNGNLPPAFWGIGFGAPKFLNTAGEGCFDPGYAELSGNQVTGDAVVQNFPVANKIIKGKKYVLQVAVKFKQPPNGPNYCRIRALAWNTTMGFTGSHPKPGSDVAIIGRSGRIKACGTWSIVEFPVWIANKDFRNIALSAFTDDNNISKILIDNVSLCEVANGVDCDQLELALDASGKPIAPSDFIGIPPGLNCPVEPEPEDSYNNGSLFDLYNGLYGYDGTTNWYAQAKEQCFSLGGTIPKEVDQYNCDDSLKVLGIKITCDELQKRLDNPDLSRLPMIRPPRLPAIPTPKNGACPNASLPNAVEMAFKGRDIIFIHGLQLDHLCDRANGVAGAKANWPDQPQEFYTGYYNSVALANFMPHILQYLPNKGNMNRYLVVSYNCSQSAEIAAHCVLTQIQEAMDNGKGVVMQSATDPRGVSCFGREYIFISHSTGALVADIALAIANMTKTNTTMKSTWGDIGLLSDRCKGRVSFRGAFGGSNLATLFVDLQIDPELSALASRILTKNICKTNLSLGVHQNMVLNSILVDLVPKVTKSKWSIYLQAVPVPVVEVSGGHPSDITPPFLKKIMHPGFDDGVLTVDCSGGNSAFIARNQPSRYRASKSLRVYDMGQSLHRARFYFRDQEISRSSREFATGVTPYLSPTGMVQPVDHTLVLPSRYANHYSFLQSSSEHWLEDIYSSGKYEPTKRDGSDNWEEQLVVENNALFSNGVISPGIVGEMHETVKEKVIWYPVLRIKFVKGIPRPIIVWKKYYIWKRTYHMMREPNWYDYDYAYKYLFKN